MGTLPPPSQLSLKSLKHQAKQLLKAQRQGDRHAWNRIRALHPASVNRVEQQQLASADFGLQDAQLVVAREYGFRSWPRLYAAVAGAAPQPDTSGQPTFRYQGAFALDIEKGPALRDFTDFHIGQQSIIGLVSKPHADFAHSGPAFVGQYSLSGAYIGRIGALGTGPGQYENACALALDPQGRLFLYEQGYRSAECKYHIFAAGGSYMDCFAGLPGAAEMLFDRAGNLLVVSNDEGNEADCGIYKLRLYPGGDLTQTPRYVLPLTKPQRRLLDRQHAPAGMVYQHSRDRLFFLPMNDYRIHEIDVAQGRLVDTFGTRPPAFRPVPEALLPQKEMSLEEILAVREVSTRVGGLTLLSDRYLLLHFTDFPTPYPGRWMLYDLDAPQRRGHMLDYPAFYTNWATHTASRGDQLYTYIPPEFDTIATSKGHFKVYSCRF
ncbi:MAG: hypothetical protein GKR89_35380 [Candidatus Latescibacteria bacterium]|nr:hypothetical protein [Candidatus Latescibacterota bacterium]